MHAVGESFNCCGRNKDTTKSKNALALMQNNMKRIDIFGYDEPAFRHSSPIGGCLTILAGLFVLQGFISYHDQFELLYFINSPIQYFSEFGLYTG